LPASTNGLENAETKVNNTSDAWSANGAVCIFGLYRSIVVESTLTSTFGLGFL
jgi:hypothetical protein